jgi:hypothetical protein
MAWQVERFQILKLEFLFFVLFMLCTKGTKRENNTYCFNIATIKHLINCSKTAKFEFIKMCTKYGLK